ncbi:amino acid ABC transporter substrate-binding protein [Acidovorax sp. Root217]|uniref:amino acid ABC transporter substrate-binding protein n=1 Tax=Acidovorax sp. Root217 TaxID=1736492 RepID=UPI000710E4A5|nr:amino acid ABC transporter substrate-binding protein [Acidovorax sp. Root217]KRC25132.1 ABC transporter substrate-binding protein [Acidovorax sp. Root217]
MQLPRIHVLACAAALSLTLGSAWAQVDTLKAIRDSGKLVMGVRDASGAMSFTLGPGQYTGFHVEVCNRIVPDIKAAARLDKLEVVYQLVTPQNRISLVRNGTVHLECGTTTNNAARQQEVAFAPTLFVEGVRIAVKASSPVAGVAQLSGKTVAATAGSTAVQAVRKMGREASGQMTEVLGKDNSEGFLLLETGRADAFVADGQILATLISRSREPAQYKILEPVLSVEPLAIMIPKDPAFKAVVDQSVAALAKSGEVARLYDKWFMQPIPPQGIRVGLPANAQTRAAWANPSDKPMEDYGPR